MNLAFTPIDEAIHGLETMAEPWTIQLELGFSGRLDGERLRASVRQGMDRHAMARVRMDPDATNWRRHVWAVASDPDLDPVRVLECPDEASLDAIRSGFYSVPIPLAESPPFRMRLVHRAGGDLVMLSVNHAAFDGFGVLRLLQSIARAYSGTPDPPSPVNLHAARAVDRILRSANSGTRRRRWARLADKARDAANPPSHIDAALDDRLPGYGFEHRALSRDDTGSISRAAKPGTVNDALMAAMHMAIDRWCRRAGDRPKRISVLMPVNVRPDQWRTDVVTNMVLQTRVATSADERASGRTAFEAVIRETARIKQGGAAALMEVLRFMPSVPVALKDRLSSAVSRAGRVVDTAVLSNLGAIEAALSFGDDAGSPTELWFSAPAKMPCGLSLGVTSFSERMHLVFRYRRSMWGPAQAAAFCDVFVDELMTP